jgi:hypothetical protein
MNVFKKLYKDFFGIKEENLVQERDKFKILRYLLNIRSHQVIFKMLIIKFLKVQFQWLMPHPLLKRDEG